MIYRYILGLILFPFVAFTQTWQLKSYDGIGITGLQRLSSGVLISSSTDYTNSVVTAFTTTGDTIWNKKFQALTISEMEAHGDSLLFCGWTPGTQSIFGNNIPLLGSRNGVIGVMSSNGTIKKFMKFKSDNMWVNSLSLKNNSLTITGGYLKDIYADTKLPGAPYNRMFVLQLDINFKILKSAFTEEGIANGMHLKTDKNNESWIILSAEYIIKFGNRYITHPDTEYCTSNGQSLIKLTSDLKMIWSKSINPGINGYIHKPIIIHDNLNNGTLLSSTHYKSFDDGKITKYNDQGKVLWSRTCNFRNQIFGQDQNYNIYTFHDSIDAHRRMIKYSQNGNLLYVKVDTTWNHHITSWHFSGEDEFYATGECSNTSKNCTNDRYISFYGQNNFLALSKNPQRETSFSIYPNPSQGEFTIQLNSQGQNENVEMIVSDMLGSVVMKKSFDVKLNEEPRIFLPSTLKGIFFVTLRMQSGLQTKKLTVQ